MTNPLDAESLPTDIPGLEAQIAELDTRMEECRASIRELMAAEDPAKSVFHAEAIHEAKQNLMMLRYQKELREARVGRLRMGDS